MKNTNFSATALRAFTLAELLMAVLVISIIMVALAPVITRRAYDNVSIEVNKKKGLEIYTNPGIYTFDIPVGINTLFLQGSAGGGGGGGATYIDKSVSFTSNTTWTVPKGVSQLTFTITGSGGGGGAGNGKANASTVSATNATSTLYNNRCLSDEFLAIRGSSDEADLCITKDDLSSSKLYKISINHATDPTFANDICNSTTDNCCWEGINPINNVCTVSINGARTGCNRPVCNYSAAKNICTWHKTITPSWSYEYGYYRLLNQAELDKIRKNIWEWSYNLNTSGLNLCSHDDPNSAGGSIKADAAGVARCRSYGGMCLNAGAGSYCFTNMLIGSDAVLWSQAVDYVVVVPMDGFLPGNVIKVNTANSGAVRCVRSLNRYTRYSGSGGASGAQLQKTINVLPNDTLTITIGAGGNGGTYNSSVNNGISSRTGNGYQGGTTQLVHKRGGITMGTYYVKGGFGGWGATTSANGAAVTNGTASNQTTPLGICYSQYRLNTTASLTGGNVSCTTLSYSGSAGTNNSAGSGGRVKNSGTSTTGGSIYIDSARTANQRNTTEEANRAKGQNATVQGFGGGGGLTPAWVTSSSHFFSGGKGASGKIDIQYRVMLPGSGGGSGTRVGGSKTVADKDTMYEIKYKVKEGSRLVFEVGAGGFGGSSGSDGTNGTPTIIGDNKIIFLAGQGGKTLSQSQKDNLSNCIGTTTNSTTIANCINNNNYKAQSAKASYVTTNSTLYTNTLGLIINDASNVSYTIANSSFKGTDGKSGSQNGSAAPYTYGFDGGVGGSPFGIRTNNIILSITCGGGITGSTGNQNDSNSYICTSGSPNGNNAKTHDPVNNEFGGSGGGGGGVKDDSFEQGQGGNGSSGYLRIRWDESEQE